MEKKNMDQETLLIELEKLIDVLQSCDIASEDDVSGQQKQEKYQKPGAQLQDSVDSSSGIQKQNDLKAVLLNVRSLKNEAQYTDVPGLLRGKKENVFLLTETWLTKKTADAELKKLFPSNYYEFYHESEDAENRRGVAIIVSKDLEIKPAEGLPTSNTFQYVAANLKHNNWNKYVLIINVYRRPGAFKQFLTEFKTFLDNAVKCGGEAILTGDFNLPNSSNFKKLLKEQCLKQHVKVKTHEKGNTLDLVISKTEELIYCLSTDHDKRLKTDHYPVYFFISGNEAK